VSSIFQNVIHCFLLALAVTCLQATSPKVASGHVSARACPSHEVAHTGRWFCIIGGPGSGKTSVIKELESRGYSVVHEAATDIIKDQIEAGVLAPWAALDFQTQVTALFDARMEQAKIEGKPVVFFDRGPVDSLSYILLLGLRYQKPVIDSIRCALDSKLFQPTVFFLENLDFCEETAVRSESLEDSKALAAQFKNDYESLGFAITSIPSLSIPERVDLILRSISFRGRGDSGE